ncbi:MAG: hypothetical protein ABI042_10250 [Verrucomicrobiota bacterium]
MKTKSTFYEEAELLVLPDGKILAHNITPKMAALLSSLDPKNELMKQRGVPTLQNQIHETAKGN